jgi:hypothetical protein
MNEVGSPVGDRLCHHPECKKPLVQRKDEQNAKFLVRKHCDHKCARSNPLNRQKQRDATKEDRLKHPKKCPVCLEDFYRRDSESKELFNRRETCGKECAAINRSKDKDALIKNAGKVCENPECGKTFYRRKGTETNCKFKARKACSPECGHAVRIKRMGWTPRVDGKRMPSKKPKLDNPLPEIPPLAREIPDAPPPPPREVWIPESWKEYPQYRAKKAS